MSGPERDEHVWRALGSPQRRRILDLLRDGPLTTGALAGAMPGLSRYAVMQHLGVLEEAGLVLVRRRGRERFNHLNAAPIREVYERWVHRFADEPARRAVALRRHVEGKGTEMSDIRTIRIETEIALRAPAERVFSAITDEQHEWYPESYGGERLQRVAFEPRVGGACYEDWGDGLGTLYGHVWYYDPPTTVCLRGYLRGAISLEHWWTIKPDGDGCVLSHSMTAFGEITEDMEKGIRMHGDMKNTEAQLRAWVEEGTPARA